MIRLQQKVNVVLEYREKEKIIKSAEQEKMVAKLKAATPSKGAKK